jgi:putative transposase
MAWAASTAGVSGEIVRDIMLMSVGNRFKSDRTPHPIQWLADNGSGFTAKETVDFAIALGLVPCFTPVPLRRSSGLPTC